MKKFFISIGLISMICALVLYFYYDYHASVILYHLLVISISCGIVFVVYWFLGYIKRPMWRGILQNALCISFFFSVLLFYLTLIGSISIWGKPIELKLLLTYLTSLGKLIATLPVQSWILITFLILFFLTAILTYVFIRPKSKQNNSVFFKRDVLYLIVFSILILVFYNPLINFKRKIHAAGEPLLGFVFPRSWHDQDEMELYKKLLIKNAGDDKTCEEAVKNEVVHPYQPNIILIVIDALRSDHLSAYGYQRKTTPFLDSMVHTGSILLVKHAFSPSTNTLGGIANIFSSHTIEDFNFNSFRLMKYMKTKKYATYAMVTGANSKWYWLTDIYRNNCDFYFESNSDLASEDDDYITLNHFKNIHLKAPSFVYLHLESVHILGKKYNQFKKYFPDKAGIGVNKSEAMINNYDNGVLQADFWVSEIFKKLQKEGQLENSILFIVADHGDLLGEDGRWGHNKSVHPYLQSVPILIYDKNAGWYANTFSATLLDIAPTIADRLGYKIPFCWKGRSLHQPATDFKIELSGVKPCTYPYGQLISKDSSFTMSLADEHHSIKRIFRMNDEGSWIEN